MGIDEGRRDACLRAYLPDHEGWLTARWGLTSARSDEGAGVGSCQPICGQYDPSIARPKRKAPEVLAKLEAFATACGKRERKLAKETDELRADRDEAIRSAYRSGVPMADTAKVLGMSHQRVSQIVRT